jgi:hypothetical protein
MRSFVNCDFFVSSDISFPHFVNVNNEQEGAAGTEGAVSIVRIRQSPQKERRVLVIQYVPPEAHSVALIAFRELHNCYSCYIRLLRICSP